MEIISFSGDHFVYLKLFLIVEANPFNTFTGIHLVYLELLFLVEAVLYSESRSF